MTTEIIRNMNSLKNEALKADLRDKVIQKIIKLMYDNGLTLNDIEAAISESVEA